MDGRERAGQPGGGAQFLEGQVGLLGQQPFKAIWSKNTKGEERIVIIYYRAETKQYRTLQKQTSFYNSKS